MNVVTFSTYRTTCGDWTSADHDARDFVRALKGQQIREYSGLKLRGRFLRFDNGNRDDVVRWFGQLVADYLRRYGPKPPFTIVPVPSSVADVTFIGCFPTLAMAHAIRIQLGAGVTVSDALRFIRPMVPSREGGIRNVQELAAHLRLVEDVDSHRVVLVDDVFVTGAHLRAAAAVLECHSASATLLAICAARASRRPVARAFMTTCFERFTGLGIALWPYSFVEHVRSRRHSAFVIERVR